MALRYRLILVLLIVSARLVPAWSAESSPPRLSHVVVVFKTHFDLGYTDLASNVVQRYRTTMIDEALGVVERSRSLPAEQQFVWTLPGWPMARIAETWPGQKPERQEQIRRALREGRFAVHALPFTTHTELLEPEELVRGLTFASRLARAAGQPLPRDAKMTDVPCHSWILPTLLRHAGVDFLHLGCNAASRSPDVPRLFWWEGPDGSRLLTMYTAESYGTGLVPPADWPYQTWLALIHTGDNHGPPAPDEVRQLLDQARQQLPGVRVTIGRLSDFADAILAERPEIPVVRGDMPDTWIHGPMSDPVGARLARNVRPEIGVTEALNTQLRLWGLPEPDLAPTVAAAYEQSLLYGEHTWGGALYWVANYDQAETLDYGAAWKQQRGTGKYRRLEASWAEHTGYIESARDLIRPPLAGQLAALAASVNVAGLRVVVYNPLPWKRDGLVTVTLPFSRVPALKSVADGAIALTEAAPDGVRFVARDVPPMGYRTYVPTTARVPEGTLKIDTAAQAIQGPHGRLEIDPRTGGLRSCSFERLPLVFGSENAAANIASPYLYERFDRDQVQAYVDAYVKIRAAWATNELGKPNLPPAREVPYRAAWPTQGRTTLAATPVSASALFQSDASKEVPHGLAIKWTLYQELPFLDLEVTLRDKPADPWPEAGWICLPFDLAEPELQVGRFGGPLTPQTSFVSGANHFLYAVQNSLLVRDARTPFRAGWALCPLDSPLASLDTPGCWRYAPRFAPLRPRIYLNLFNNQWTTNFRLWNEGSWSSRVRLWNTRSYPGTDGLATPALEARYPLQAGVAQGTGGWQPVTQAGLAVPDKDVLVSAFGANPDGDGLVLRLWEMRGMLRACRVSLPRVWEVGSAQPVDLRGRPVGDPIPIARDRFEVGLRPGAPASFVLHPAVLRRTGRSTGAAVPRAPPALPKASLRPAPRLEMPRDVDCNTPSHWHGETLYVFNSTGHPYRSSGQDLFHLGPPAEVKFDNQVNGGRWIEATWPDANGVLYAWYHHEPAGLCPGTTLTAPKIGALRSTDQGATWQDLGIILEARPNTLKCEAQNGYFAGGHGDFSVMLDADRRWLYFFYGNYAGDVGEQGVAVARMAWADRDAPVGKVLKWHRGGFAEPGLGGRPSPTFPAFAAWEGEDCNAFWGPSVHWNTHLEQYVMLLNRAKAKGWVQEGIYVSYSRDLADPLSWSPPVKILEGGQWYPVVVGLGEAQRGTDKLAGQVARFFMGRFSDWEIVFARPVEVAAPPNQRR